MEEPECEVCSKREPLFTFETRELDTVVVCCEECRDAFLNREWHVTGSMHINAVLKRVIDERTVLVYSLTEDVEFSVDLAPSYFTQTEHSEASASEREARVTALRALVGDGDRPAHLVVRSLDEHTLVGELKLSYGGTVNTEQMLVKHATEIWDLELLIELRVALTDVVCTVGTAAFAAASSNHRWIQGAIRHPGALRAKARRMGLLRSNDDKLSATDLNKLAARAHSMHNAAGRRLAAEVNLARRFKRMHH